MWTPIPSNQNLLPVTQLVLYMQMYSQCGTRLKELIQQNLQHKEAYHLLHLNLLWCWNSMEANNDWPTIQTNGDIGIDAIMELEWGPMANDNHSNSNDHEKCDNSTMCYDLVPSYLVPSDHVISAFQHKHQAFLLVKLKDSIKNALGHTYHSLSPMVPICLDHTFAQTPNLHLHTALTEWSNKHAVINMGNIISLMSQLMNTASWMKILVWSLMSFDQYDFYYDLEELQEPANPSAM